MTASPPPVVAAPVAYDADFSFRTRMEFYFEGQVLDVPPRDVKAEFEQYLRDCVTPILPFPAIWRHGPDTPGYSVTVTSLDGMAATVSGGDANVVPVVELYPMRSGDEKLERFPVSVAIEHARFFYEHIWRPGDSEDETDETYSLKYVSERMKEAYGLDLDRPPEGTADHIIELLGNLPRRRPTFPGKDVARLRARRRVAGLGWWLGIWIPIAFLLYVTFCDVDSVFVSVARDILNVCTLGLTPLSAMTLAVFQNSVLLHLITIPAIIIHFGEGFYALWLAWSIRNEPLLWWFLQTTLLGFPSLGLILAIAREEAAAKKDM